MLQIAMSHAEHPEQTGSALKRERIGCSVDDPDLDTAVAASRMNGQSCHMPGARRIIARITEDVRLVAAPVVAEKQNGVAARADGLLAGLAADKDDLLDPDATTAMMQARDPGSGAPPSRFRVLPEAADDAADELEDAVFLLDLDTLQGKPLEDMRTLADLLEEAAQEWIKASGHAGEIGQLAGRSETEDFLEAVDRVSALEPQADDAERALAASAIQHTRDFRQLHLFTSIGRKFEAAADALKPVSLLIRDYMLEDVIDG